MSARNNESVQPVLKRTEEEEKEREKTVFMIAYEQAKKTGNLGEFLWKCFSQKADKAHQHPL